MEKDEEDEEELEKPKRTKVYGDPVVCVDEW